MNRAEPAEWSKLLREQADLYARACCYVCDDPPTCDCAWHATQARKFREAATVLETGETGCSEPAGATAGIPEPATTDETAPASPRAGR